MGKPKYDPPTSSFPYKIPKRLNMLSVPKRGSSDMEEDKPLYTPMGVRQSALKGQLSERVTEIAYPQLRRLLILKRTYKNRFSPQRLERLDSIIEASNATWYTKLANCTVDLKRDAKDPKKKRGWSDSEWKKHMDYIGQIAVPKKVHAPPPIKRGDGKPLQELLPRIRDLAAVPDNKLYVRESQQSGYKDPIKVSPGALKYVITERIKKLASPRPLPQNHLLETENALKI